MKDRKPEILYSDPVQEIMGKPPRKILRWGTSLMSFVFVIFILFAWLIRYPDTIPSPVEITTVNPPVTLVTKITGRIKELNVNERDTVSAGQILAVMETTASMQEIEMLRHTIDTVTKPETLLNQSMQMFSELGELQEYYASFQKALSDLNSYLINDVYGTKIKSLAQEIYGIQEYIDRLRGKEKLYIDNQRLEEKKFDRISSLYADSVVTEAEMELADQSLLNIKMELQEVQLDLSAKSIELTEKRYSLEDNRIKRKEEEDRFVSILRESFLNLKAQINIWEYLYLLISPIDGIVSFSSVWSANQFVVQDEAVINIIPLDPGKYLGRINLKMHRSGKVEQGQLVNIKLSGYPYMEYGMVKGEVKSKSLVPSGDTYIIEINLPYGLTTSYGINLDFTQKMQGTAEIMTEDIRLLQKIVNPFRYMISKNKR